MRISNISQYAGGANDVVADEYVNGAKMTTSVSLKDEAGTAIDLTGYTYELDVQFATATVSGPSGSANAITVSNMVLTPAATLPAKDISSSVTAPTPTNGTIEVAWPVNLFEGDVPLDAMAAVPVVVGTLYINDNTTSNTISTVRFLRFVRFGASN